MDLALYRKVAAICDRNIAERSILNLQAIQRMFPHLTNLDVVLIIYRQQYQRHIRRTSHVHRRDYTIRKYIRLYEEGKSIVEIASIANFSPYLLARIMMERILTCGKKDVSKYVRNPGLIPDVRLRSNVAECIEMDEYCSPYVDRIRRTLGLEYEYVLQQKLLTAGIPFDSEDTLRGAGWSKTPDVKLQIPISVRFRDRDYVINWIDSKAMFGDPHSHESENMKQLQGYLNRFGTGMVIYWFGYVESLNSSSDILVLDHVPRNIKALGREKIVDVTLDAVVNDEAGGNMGASLE
eukprot:g2217.t1